MRNIQKDTKKLVKKHVNRQTIDWKTAIDNVLPWIKEEIEKNGGDKRSITVDMSTLLDKMNISPEIKKEVNRSSFKFSFQNNIIGKGYDIKSLKGGLFEIISDVNCGPRDKYIIEEHKKHRYISISDHLREIEKEDNIRKQRYQFMGNTLSVYKENVDYMMPLIKEGMDNAENGIFAMSMEDVRRILGHKFNVYSDISVYNNIKIVMENCGIVVDSKGLNTQKQCDKYIRFRYKRDDEKFIWEEYGFSSRNEYEEYKKWNRNCNNIRKIIDENKNIPESVFSDKKFIKKIISRV